MLFATNTAPAQWVALLLTDSTFHALKDTLIEWVGPRRQLRHIRLHDQPERLLSKIIELRPSGILMEFHPELVEWIIGLGTPCVVINGEVLSPNIFSLVYDHNTAAKMAALYLRSKNVSHFAFAGDESIEASIQRSAFFAQLKIASSSSTSFTFRDITTGNRQSQMIRMEHWLQDLPKPTGLLTSSVNQARSLIEACERLQIQVPGHIAVLAINDSESTAEFSYPQITTLEAPHREFASLAMEYLSNPHERTNRINSIAPAGIKVRASTDHFATSEPRLQKAIQFLQENFKDHITTNDMARAAGINRRTLERLFKSELHISPKALLTTIRLERARQELEQRKAPINSVAESNGFNDASRFAAQFRKKFDCSPREWCRSH